MDAIAHGSIASSAIFIVDDDMSVRETLSFVFKLAGCSVSSFPEGDTMLEALEQDTPDCILLDLNLPGRSGLDLLRELQIKRRPIPVVVISGSSDVSTVVDAMKSGASDFIEKPFDRDSVLRRVGDAVRKSKQADPLAKRPIIPPLVRRRLTEREFQVLERIAAGQSNKNTARELGISPRTVEIHRAHIMQKLNARNFAELLRMVLVH